MTNPNQQPGLMARRKVKTYEQWFRRFLRFYGMRHQHVVCARKPQGLSVVLTEEEVRSVLQQLEESEALVAGLLYGSGLRLMEALRLRSVHDLGFKRQELTICNGKGGKERCTMLPIQPSKKLQIHLENLRIVCQRDLMDGWGAVQLPYALARKYRYAVTGGLVMVNSPTSALARSNSKTTGSPSSRSEFDTETRAERCPGSWYQQAGQPLQLASISCHTLIRERTGHLHNSGIDGSQGTQNNNDLFSCSQSRFFGFRQPGRFPVKKGLKAARDTGFV